MKLLLFFLTYFKTDKYLTDLINVNRAQHTLVKLVDLSKYILGIAAIFGVIYAFKHYVKGDNGDSDSAFLKIAVGLAVCAIMLYVIQAVALKIGSLPKV